MKCLPCNGEDWSSESHCLCKCKVGVAATSGTQEVGPGDAWIKIAN